LKTIQIIYLYNINICRLQVYVQGILLTWVSMF